MTELTIHSCIKARGKAKGCPKCPVMLKGFCPSLIDFILRAENNTQKKYLSISEHDRHAIIADTVSAIAANIDSFERRKGSQFSTWAWRIYLNIVADFFRQAREWAPIDNMIASELPGHGRPHSYSYVPRTARYTLHVTTTLKICARPCTQSKENIPKSLSRRWSPYVEQTV